MKKILAIFLMAVLVVSAGLLVFAAPNGFVSSPSSTDSAPPIVSFTPGNGSTTITLNIIPYGDREEMEEELLKAFEEAYKSIVEAEDLSNLTEDLKDVAEEKNIDTKNLAVSDLFDIHTEGVQNEEGKIEFEITLDLELLSHFVALLHMKNGEWEVVEDAQVVGNGNHLKFSVDSLSPFAVVINASEGTPPSTGENAMIYVYAGLMVASALALAVVLVKSKKQKI